MSVRVAFEQDLKAEILSLSMSEELVSNRRTLVGRKASFEGTKAVVSRAADRRIAIRSILRGASKFSD